MVKRKAEDSGNKPASKKSKKAEARAQARRWIEEQEAKNAQKEVSQKTPLKVRTKPTDEDSGTIIPNVSPHFAEPEIKQPLQTKVAQVVKKKKKTQAQKLAEAREAARLAMEESAQSRPKRASRKSTGTMIVSEPATTKRRSRKSLDPLLVSSNAPKIQINDAEMADIKSEETQPPIPVQPAQNRPVIESIPVPPEDPVPAVERPQVVHNFPQAPMAPPVMSAPSPQIGFPQPSASAASKQQHDNEQFPPKKVAQNQTINAHEGIDQKYILNLEQSTTENDEQQQLEIERQISEQVLGNALAFKEYKEQSPSQNSLNRVQMHQAEPPEQENKKQRRPFLSLLLIVAILGVSAFFGSLFLGGDAAVGPASKEPPCFLDKHVAQVLIVENNSTCDRSLPTVACPADAICSQGVICGCMDESYDLSGDGSMCVWSSVTNVTLAKVEDIMSQWTVQHICSLNGCEFARKGTHKGPVFTLSKLQEEVGQANQKLLSMSSNFVVITETDDEEILVGLSDQYMETSLELSWFCYTAFLLAALVSSFASAAYWIVFSVLFNVAMAYPLFSFVCLLIVLFIRRRENNRKEEARLIQETAMVRQSAYQLLQSNGCGQHAILHVRDEIAMNSFPTSQKDRSRMIMKVWPRVVADIRLDNRVAKSTKMYEGRRREVWQWVATPNSNRTVQFSTKKAIGI